MVNNTFRKVVVMLQNLKRVIFGIPAENVEASRAAKFGQAQTESPQFLPESALTKRQINGSDSGENWERWRISSDTNEQWYRRVSGDSPAAEIRGEAKTDDTNNDDDVEAMSDIVQKFHRDLELIRTRYELENANRLGGEDE